VDPEAIEHYLADGHLRAEPFDGGFDGAAGGAACGDLVRFSLKIERGTVAAISFAAEGCAVARAAAAATAELAEGAAVLEAAVIDPDRVAAELGGVGPQGRHAVELAADALARALAGAAGSTLELASRPAGGERVLVALSGGVDSAVAALRERERGAAVVAVTLKLWSDQRTDSSKSCCSPLAVLGARGLAHSLEIPHFTLDLEDAFRAQVVGGFVEGYRAGRTPNPCVVCNGELRIDAMLALSRRLGCSVLATGHYARLADDGEGPLLSAAADPAKDQTYMLAAVAPATLERLRFPLGELTKPEVRALAAEAGLPVASKAESQDLCFLAGTGKAAFLARHAGLVDRPGEIVDRDGRVLAAHRGAHHFTVGQRKGLGVAGPEPLYVLATDTGSNRVVAGPRAALATHDVILRGARLHRDAGDVDRVRLRSHAPALPCRVAESGARGRLALELLEPADGAAPGQTACLLRGDVVVGWGTIART